MQAKRKGRDGTWRILSTAASAPERLLSDSITGGNELRTEIAITYTFQRRQIVFFADF